VGGRGGEVAGDVKALVCALESAGEDGVDGRIPSLKEHEALLEATFGTSAGGGGGGGGREEDVEFEARSIDVRDGLVDVDVGPVGVSMSSERARLVGESSLIAGPELIDFETTPSMGKISSSSSSFKYTKSDHIRQCKMAICARRSRTLVS